MNIVKVREDKEPVEFEKEETQESSNISFKTKKENESYCGKDSFSEINLRLRIEPWLSSLFQSEHLSLLVGSGLTSAVQFEATGNANNGMKELDLSKTKYKDEIKAFASESAKKTGRGNSNIEDEIRIANELLRGLEISGLDTEKSFEPDKKAGVSYAETGSKPEATVFDPDAKAEVPKRAERTPVEGSGGCWDGERGNSNWIPDDNEVPSNPKTNPDKKNWRKIKDDYNIEKIPFKDNESDFSEISKGTVEISGFSDDRDSNFNQADEKLAEQKGCKPEDVYRWRKENRYTWHEKSDCKTMQKVPTEVHGNVPHSGGVAEFKSRS